MTRAPVKGTISESSRHDAPAGGFPAAASVLHASQHQCIVRRYGPRPVHRSEYCEPRAAGRVSHSPFFSYGFRSRGGKSIVAYWLGERTHPKHPFEPVYVDLTLQNTGIVHPVLIDIDADTISPLAWETSSTSALRHVPVRDSVMAIADENYFDWAVTPEIPAPLHADIHGLAVKLTWPPTRAAEEHIVVERRVGGEKNWMEAKTVPGDGSYEEREDAKVSSVAFRVRAANASGKSGYSNVETVVVTRGAKTGR